MKGFVALTKLELVDEAKSEERFFHNKSSSEESAEGD